MILLPLVMLSAYCFCAGYQWRRNEGHDRANVKFGFAPSAIILILGVLHYHG